ncbi:hypothetical protein Tco_0079476 [Tanacetum coccineum]
MNHQISTVPHVIPQVAYQSPQAPTQLMTESPFVDSGFVVPVFSPGDDPIACLNKAMAFLTAVASLKFPTTNNQLRTSSNPRNQATIQDGRVTVQQTKDLDTYDSDYDDLLSAQAVLMANISNYGSNVILEEKANKEQNNESITAELERYKERVKTFEQRLNIDLSSREKMIDSQIDDMIREKLALKEKIDSLEQNLSKQIKEKESLFKTFTIFNNESKETENKYMENEIDLEKKIKELDNIVYKMGQSALTVHMLTKPQEFYDNTHKQALELSAGQAFWFHTFNPTIEPSYSPPIIVDVPSELPKVSLVNASLKKLKFYLTQFDSVVKKRTTPSALEEGEWGFEHTKAIFNNEIIPFLKSLKDIFNVFDKDLLNEITEVQTVFDQMEASVQQFLVDKKCLEIAMKEILLENDRLLQKIMSQDVLITVMNSMSLNNDSVNVNMQKCELCEKCMNLDAELSKSKQAYNDLLKNHSQLEKHCISLEVSMQLKQEVFQNDESCVNQNAVEIQEYFEINDLKARLQDKDTTISKLKDTIKSLKKNTKEKNVHHDKCDLEPINEELENRKEIVENVVHIPSATTLAPGMFKFDLVPLPPRLLQNREVHINYLRNTQEQANILWEIVKQVKAKQPLDGNFDLACKYATRIQELLVYVQDTYPNAITPSTKKVESSNTSDSNTPVLSSIGVKCSTSICGSKLPGNKKNDRISQTPSRNKKNKVEAQPRKVNKMNRVVKPVCDVDVKQSLSNANSDILCATCHKSMFDGVHDKCLLDLVRNGNNRAKSAKKHKN